MNRVNLHNSARGNLSDKQFGFRKGRSTNGAVNFLKNTVLETLEKHQICVAVGLDIRNVFNFIRCKHIMSALWRLEVPDYLLRMLGSYLSNRAVESVQTLLKVQRRAALRTICGYNSISYDVINVIIAMPPIDLLVVERKEQYISIRMKTTTEGARVGLLRESTMMKWQARYDQAEKGIWTRLFIRDVREWVCRPHGVLDFHLRQVFTEHGCFGKYLKMIRNLNSATCVHCGLVEDNARHTLLECGKWEAERAELEDTFRTLEVEEIAKRIVGSRESWQAMSRFAAKGMYQKEERERED